MQFSAAAVTGGGWHMSRGASNNLIEFKFDKIAPRAYNRRSSASTTPIPNRCAYGVQPFTPKFTERSSHSQIGNRG
jgi:hypothetical protein